MDENISNSSSHELKSDSLESQPESYTQKALKGTIMLFLITSLGALVAYVLRIILARSLTPAEYGLFYAVFVFISFFNIIRGMGVDYAVVSKIPALLIKKDYDKCKSVIYAAIFIQFTIAVIISIVLFFLSDFLAVHYFKAPAASLILKLLLILFISDVFAELLKKTYQAFQKTTYFAVIELTKNLLILTWVVIFLYFDFKIYAPAIAYPLASLCIIGFFLPIFIKKVFNFKKHKSTFSKGLALEMVYFGIPAFMFLVGYKIVYYSDVLVLTYFRTLTEVGIYNVVVPTATFALFFSRSIAWVMMPLSSELWAKQEFSKLADGLNRLHKYALVVMVPLILGLMAYSKEFITFFFREEYAPGALALQITLLGTAFYAISDINTGIFVGIGKPKLNAKVLLTAAVVNVILNFALIPKYGIEGAAAATALCYLLAFFLSIRYMKKEVNYKMPWKDFFKVSFAGLIFYFIVQGLKYLVNNYLDLGIFGLIILIIFSILIYFGLILWLKVTSLSEINKLIRPIFKKKST